MKKNLKILLTILVIIIIAPLIFVGTCFPIGFAGFTLSFKNVGPEAVFGTILLIAAWIIGAVATIIACVYLIKWVVKPDSIGSKTKKFFFFLVAIILYLISIIIFSSIVMSLFRFIGGIVSYYVYYVLEMAYLVFFVYLIIMIYPKFFPKLKK